MELARRAADLRRILDGLREKGRSIGLTVVAGGVHAGHVSLVKAAEARGDVPVVVLFAGPTGDDQNEDRALEARGAILAEDLAALEMAGVAVVAVPPIEDVYPPGFATFVRVRRFTDVLCAERIPGYFDLISEHGVKFLNLTGAERLYVGEKDWQEYLVLSTMVRDLDFPVEVVVCPTVRARDGLALSSRNRRLRSADMALAAKLHGELERAAERIAGGDPTEFACVSAQENLVLAGIHDVEYIECRNAETLRLAPSPAEGARVLAAIRLGGVRLIDNVPVPGP